MFYFFKSKNNKNLPARLRETGSGLEPRNPTRFPSQSQALLPCLVPPISSVWQFWGIGLIQKPDWVPRPILDVNSDLDMTYCRDSNLLTQF